MQKKKKSMIFGLVFLLIMTVATLTFLLNFNDFNETMHALGSMARKPLWCAIGCLLAYILLHPLSLCVICRVRKIKTSFTQNYLIGSIEHFFNGITPYQTGAQPFQVYSYTRRGVPASEGTGVIITAYLTQLIAANGLMLLSLIFAGDFFGSFRSTLWIPVLGFVMNLLTLVLFFCLATCQWVRVALKKFLHWLCRFRWIGKRLTKSIPTFEEYCDNAQLGAKQILMHPRAFFGACCLRVLALLFYYSIPFFILNGLGVPVGYDFFFYTMMATCFAINAVVWIPTPGTSGAIELSFTLLFALFAGFTGAVSAAAAILWRGLTYYLLLIISLLEYIALEVFFKKKAKDAAKSQ